MSDNNGQNYPGYYRNTNTSNTNNNSSNYGVGSQGQPLRPPPHQTPLQPTPPPGSAPPRRRKKRRVSFVPLFVICVIVAGAAGFAGGFLAIRMQPEQEPIFISEPSQPVRQPEQQATPQAPPEAQEKDPPEEQASPPKSSASVSEAILGSNPPPQVKEDPPMTAADVAAAVRDSVVEIKTETVTSSGWGGTRVAEGAGSGVIISVEGIIVTNHHVISGAATITVRLADGREFEAGIIGTDPRTDIAVLRITASGLKAAVFGDSSVLVVGESALAVGNPLGELGGTVTGGIISALDRDLVVDGQIMTLLQTDAAVNPGNSGGGLFNMNAELIGVVVAKSSGLDIEGLGFAIPSATASAVIRDLIDHGFVRGRTDAGLELVDIQTTQAARAYRVNQLGLYILESTDEQLMRGDRIIAVGGRDVTNQTGYDAALRHYSIGDTVSITVARGGQSLTFHITLTEWTPQ